LKNMENNSSRAIRAVRIILLVLIVVGIGLIVTRDMWVPNLVNYIVGTDSVVVEPGIVVPSPVASSTPGPLIKPSPVPEPSKMTSGVDGFATIGPTCPVMRIPPDPACADKPYKTTLVLASTIIGRNGGVLIFTDERGYFSHDLGPGTYIIRAQSSTQLPRLSPVSFTVKEGERVKLNLQFDSGIR
jgi:hypothetical protein